jgi:hypothetical protein
MITDEHGNKLPQSKVRKRDAARAVRMHRAGESSVSAFCRHCGFRDRGPNHLEGNHHNGTVKECKK